ncbi:hypothetical protein TPHA_0A01900 [Tetrapisispora phaffii CBS 4417]|uniref:Methyltransferase type 11 domain-containing protein n=1 Tax=Tetrapisispora phaffii (strain ATCC 24235 / CBS 4417 / NBRC 1672 / NRRL Y-8282 / UCD 70-5) TaxID=1071381 RepID=G8BMZ5_TETPH|nr:hypothetical protein TPHA_0A01900 [Tetrapisispora phaffii CBS 4417]CCE61273.1 hypothetical protein TPHA_0A01900 [Tetrapisispora phaffii CBS 4417]
MSQFSSPSYAASRYDANRPECPRTVLNKVVDYYKIAAKVNGTGSLLVDVGCGSGNSTRLLYSHMGSLGGSPLIDRFVGCDVSQKMISFAKASVREMGLDSSLSFDVIDYLELQNRFDANSVEILTCMESVHWFTDIESFWGQCHRILKDKVGVLAVWGYVDPVILEYPRLDAIFEDLTYGNNKLGNDWSQPGRTFLKNLLKDIKIDNQSFTDIEENVITVDQIRKAENLETLGYVLKRKMKLQDLKDYFKTYSSYHSWKLRNSEGISDIIDQAFELILKQENTLTMDAEVTVIWNSTYKLARKY